MIGWIIGTIVGGLVVGALARLVMPGRQDMSILMTILLGMGGSMLGGVVKALLFNRPAGLIFHVLGAVAVLYVYQRTRRPALDR